jgi:hypothetical protein
MARIAQIISTARYLPEHLVTNAELTARFTALGRPHVIDNLRPYGSLEGSFTQRLRYRSFSMGRVRSETEGFPRPSVSLFDEDSPSWQMSEP